MSEKARKAEAAGSFAEFEFRGESFQIPTEWNDFPLAYIEAASEGAPLAIQCREILGAEQWARVKAMGLTGAGLDELAAAIEGANGTTAGESQASSNS